MRRLILAFSLLLVGINSAYALRSTKVDGHTDPDFVGYKPRKVVLITTGANTDTRTQIEERAAQELRAYGVQIVPERDVFPPTREWTPEARAGVLERLEIDSALLIAVGVRSSEAVPFAQQTYGTTNVSGNVGPYGTVNARGSTQSTSVNLIAARSVAEFSAVLIEVASGKTVWVGDISTKAAGTLFVGEKGDAKASVKGVIEGLREDGHLTK